MTRANVLKEHLSCWKKRLNFIKIHPIVILETS